MKKRSIRVKRTRGSESLTEAQFWYMIRSTFRERSKKWKPINECKKKARREYKGTNKRQKYEYQCNHCKKWFPEKEINVDHIIPVGSLRCSDDLPGFIERLFVEVDGLQVLCNKCHDIKTKNEKLKI